MVGAANDLAEAAAELAAVRVDRGPAPNAQSEKPTRCRETPRGGIDGRRMAHNPATQIGIELLPTAKAPRFRRQVGGGRPRPGGPSTATGETA